VTDLAKRLNIPLVWLVNCSGVKLPEQEKFYANRRGAGTPFSATPSWSSRHSGPGRHLRHQSGRRRIPGHQPHHPFRPQGLQYRRGRRRHRQRHVAQGRILMRRGRGQLIEKPPSNSRPNRPGSVKIHYDETGFFRYVFDEERKSWTASRTT
jgi:glutaconyl-CoA decarboxylase subunit alpha